MATTKRPRKKATGALRSDAAGAKEFKARFDELQANIESVIKGKAEVVRLALVAIMCEGHVLFEDLPGTGKSMLARSLAQSMDATVGRVQCTPDLLPGDITGSSIFNQQTRKFEFQKGPAFNQIMLADEINRATPKTQSALLEAMAERRVSADGHSYPLPRPFFVIGTQNPIEQAGTFPLPEAQLDRFTFKLSMGYLERKDELDVMFDNSGQLKVEDLGAVLHTSDVEAMIGYASTIEVSDEVGYYIVDLIHASRNDPAVATGGSPRATIALLKSARSLAASDGRRNVYPDDVRTVLTPVLAHRLQLRPEGLLRGESVEAVIDRIVGSVKAPLVAAA